MKKKPLIYLTMAICGIVLIVSSIVLDGRVSAAAGGALMGVGAALIGLGFSRWQFARWEKKNPAGQRLYEIEAGDERNVAIRLRAKAAAGDTLQWTVMAAAWIAIFLSAPLWVILAFVGIFLFKTIMEMCLMAKYQKEM